MFNKDDLDKLTICTRCIYDETTAGIQFDSEGVCNYCKMMEDLNEEYKPGTEFGKKNLDKILNQIRTDGKGKQFDCVVGVSGGTDSSYMLYKCVEWGLRPLAVHYDNTWNTAIATENIRKVLGKLNVPLHTHVVDNREVDDIFKSFFLAGVPELDCATDIGLAETLYRGASKYGVQYIFQGHSFNSEGVSPLGASYVDGKYIESIVKEYGTTKIKTFPNMTFAAFMKWLVIKRIKRIRPFWYIDYVKKDAQEFLKKEFDWVYYGGHHLENRITAFNHSYYYPVKFGIDQRNNTLSACVRNGLMTRDEAIDEYCKPPHIEEDLVKYFKDRLELTDERFEEIMNGPKRTYKDFKTYKQRFEKLRPFFYLMYKANLVPKSFYIKYTSKSEM